MGWCLHLYSYPRPHKCQARSAYGVDKMQIPGAFQNQRLWGHSRGVCMLTCSPGEALVPQGLKASA